MPSERNVLLQKDTKRCMTLIDHDKNLSPDLLKLNKGIRISMTACLNASIQLQ